MAFPYGTVNRDQVAQRTEDNLQNKMIFNRYGCPKVYLAAISALFNIVNLGLVTSYTAPAGVRLEKSHSIRVTSEEISWIASMVSVGALFGGLLSGYASQKFGRKAVLMYVSLPFLIGWLMIGYATSVEWIYSGRFVTGLCCGIVSVTVPTYIVEISTPDIRGLICAWFNVAFATGVLLDMTLGAILTWEWLAVSGAVLSTVSVMLLSLMPESPYWLISNRFDSQAFKALRFLRGHRHDAVSEYQIIAEEIENENRTVIKLQDVWRNSLLYKPISICVCLMFFQQFSGINALMSYTVEILQHADTTWDPSIITIVICAVQVISTIICSLLMDRLGRRLLFIFSGLFLTIGLTVLGLFTYLTRYGVIQSSAYGWMPIAGFMIYLVAFSLGFGPVPWVMSPEMVPTQARSYVVAIATLCTNSFMFIIVKTYEELRIMLFGYGIYFLYATFCLLGCGFCLMFVPETKGKPLDEIQKFFKVVDASDDNEKQRLLYRRVLNQPPKVVPRFKEIPDHVQI